MDAESEPFNAVVVGPVSRVEEEEGKEDEERTVKTRSKLSRAEVEEKAIEGSLMPDSSSFTFKHQIDY